ncbi:AMP-binding protein [Actinomadura sp. LOL_016]|uniref:AMP-binding protein n=1 Tax=unclassified Actinomadura TaxID=2626254 RepID=UPI003A802342
MTLQPATLFEAVAAAVPDRLALVCGDRRATFADLDRRADAQAARLRASGIGPGEQVGLHMPNGVETRPGTGPSADELRAHCRDHLAGYKIPAIITFTGAVTRSPSGKADYRWAKRVLTGQEGSPHA